MTSERKQDVFLIALVVSLVLHVATMFWVRSCVMTQTLSPRRAAKHVPVTIREAPKLATPTEIEELIDVSAKKSAPVAESGTAAPTANEALPVPTAEYELSAPAAPTVSAELKLETPVETVAVPAPMISDPTVVSAPVAEGPSVMSHLGSDLVIAVPPPSAALAVAPPAVAPVPVQVRRETSAEPRHVVPEEVLAEVDEKFVESEKKAVRQLMDADSALDLTRAVSVRLEKSVADGWTYFRVTVTPKVNLPSVPKDVVVLLDASGSIGFDRLASCRKAAKRILRTCTNTGDRFNLVAFRDRFSYAFRSWQECNATSFSAADNWLANLVAHGRTDVFSTIRSVLTLPREPSRPLIAMVVTDGDANAGVSETKEILSKFTELNDGLVSVYMYGVRKSANRELIDVLTHGNRGESLVYDSWQMWNAGDGIEGLTERFRDPLITDLRVIFASSLRAVAYPTALKNLYRGNSVTVTGRVPGAPASLDFSLRGLAGHNAYEGFFRLPLSAAAVDPKLAETFASEAALAASVR